jgi:hypothetical protein
LTLSNQEIVELIDSMSKDAKAIKEELLTLCWYMRGSVSYDDSMMLSPEERDIINSIIKKNLEATKETGLPFF